MIQKIMLYQQRVITMTVREKNQSIIFYSGDFGINIAGINIRTKLVL